MCYWGLCKEFKKISVGAAWGEKVAVSPPFSLRSDEVEDEDEVEGGGIKPNGKAQGTKLVSTNFQGCGQNGQIISLQLMSMDRVWFFPA